MIGCLYGSPRYLPHAHPLLAEWNPAGFHPARGGARILSEIAVIVFHHNDADGRCAAAIALLAYPGATCVELDYKDTVPVELIGPDGCIIVDFSFKPSIMEAAQARGPVIWIDHHASAKDYGYDVVGLRDFTDKGLSGCELTWKYFNTEPMPYFVQLLGDYDSWRLKEPDSLAFYEGLKLEDQSPVAGIWDTLLSDVGNHFVNQVIKHGKVTTQYRDRYCAEMRKAFGYETELDGHRAYALNVQRFGSLAFDSEHPLYIAYVHDGTRYTVSLYSKTIDVSVIAKKYGGGGHSGAAGFVCEKLPWA